MEQDHKDSNHCQRARWWVTGTVLTLGIASLLFSFLIRQYSQIRQSSPHLTKSDSSCEPPGDIHIPPERDYGIPAGSQTGQSSSLAAASAMQASGNTLSAVESWNKLLSANPTHEQIRAFFRERSFAEICEVMEHLCASQPDIASVMFAYDIIPLLKTRWAADGRWADNAPYDHLLSLAADKDKTVLFRRVMMDILGTGARESENEALRLRVACSLMLIADDASEAEAVQVSAINMVGIISHYGDAEASVSTLIANVANDSAPASIRHASIHALSRMGATEIIPELQAICNDYHAESNPTVVRAAVVALGDFAHAQQANASAQITKVLNATTDPDVYGSAVHAMSQLDADAFVAGLPSIMAAQARFEGNSLARNSLIASLWARPAEVIAALDSDNPTVLSAAIQAATLVPLPPARPRLETLLRDSSRSDHGAIEHALTLSRDESAYQRILKQSEKAKEMVDEK